MHDRWEYVAVTYGLTAGILGLWFAMIGAKLRRLRRTQRGAASMERSHGA